MFPLNIVTYWIFHYYHYDTALWFWLPVTKRLLYRPQELWTSWDEWISRHGEGGKAVGSVGGMFEDYLPRQTGTVFRDFFKQCSVLLLLLFLLLLLLLPGVMLERHGMYILDIIDYCKLSFAGQC